MGKKTAAQFKKYCSIINLKKYVKRTIICIMMLSDVLNKIESKWGEFLTFGHALCNKQMTFVSEKAYLNILYKPQINAIKKAFNSFSPTIPLDLLDFYKKYNGCRLFFSSLNIFGVQCFDEEIYEPFDLALENHIIQESFKDNNYVFFASLGGDYAFAYKKDECSKIYAVKKVKRKFLKCLKILVLGSHTILMLCMKNMMKKDKKSTPINDIKKYLLYITKLRNSFKEKKYEKNISSSFGNVDVC